MQTAVKHVKRDRAEQRSGLPDGVGGTISGGPMKPIDLMEILSRASRGASRGVSLGGAVSGAAQVMASGPGAGTERARGIALSDGSEIIFASVNDVQGLVSA
jgi:hypothetical protein